MAAGLRAVTGESSRLVAAHVRAETETGRLRPVEAEVLSRLLLSSVMFAVLFEEPEDPEHFVEESVGILLGGLIPERPDAGTRPSGSG